MKTIYTLPLLILGAPFIFTGCGGGGSDTTQSIITTVPTIDTSDTSSSSETETTVTNQDYLAYVSIRDITDAVCVHYDERPDSTQYFRLSPSPIALTTDQSVCEEKLEAWIARHQQDIPPNNTPEIEALEYLNRFREAMGITPLRHNDKLATAATMHDYYMIEEYKNTRDSSVLGHYETNTSNPYYTGKEPVDRAAAQGYDLLAGGEVLTIDSTYNTPSESLKHLITAVYHRFLLFDYTNAEIGISNVTEENGSEVGMYPKTFDFGDYDSYWMARAPKVMVYPYEDEEEVARLFDNKEIPDPLTDIDGNVGFPITVQFNEYYYHDKEINITHFQLYENGIKVDDNKTRLLKKDTPNQDGVLSDYQFVLFPLDVLQADTQYCVELTYRIDEESTTKIWCFTTTTD